jgi:hypothetical protein
MGAPRRFACSDPIVLEAAEAIVSPLHGPHIARNDPSSFGVEASRSRMSCAASTEHPEPWIEPRDLAENGKGPCRSAVALCP